MNRLVEKITAIVEKLPNLKLLILLIDVIDLKECSPILAHYVARDGQLLYERETGLFEGFKEKFLMNPEESKALYRQLRNNLEISLREKGV